MSGTAIGALAVAAVAMLVELAVSRRNERALIARGAVAPPDPVYPAMRLAYPGVYVLMAIEGLVRPPADAWTWMAGGGLFLAGKLLKVWAIAALDGRWTYRVLVLPGVPLVADGPYRFVRHPNYVAVLVEMAGFAVVTHAVLTGPVAIVLFGGLVWRRMVAEERGLGLGR